MTEERASSVLLDPSQTLLVPLNASSVLAVLKQHSIVQTAPSALPEPFRTRVEAVCHVPSTVSPPTMVPASASFALMVLLLIPLPQSHKHSANSARLEPSPPTERSVFHVPRVLSQPSTDQTLVSLVLADTNPTPSEMNASSARPVTFPLEDVVAHLALQILSRPTTVPASVTHAVLVSRSISTPIPSRQTASSVLSVLFPLASEDANSALLDPQHS